MGGFLPTAILSAVQLGVDSVQRGQQAEAAARLQQEQARYQIEQVRRTQSIEDQRRRQALKEALATQRARFGGQGTGHGSSADAVLAGLVAEAEREADFSEQLSSSKIQNINTRNYLQQKRDLLDYAQPNLRNAFSMLRSGIQRVPLI
jgi:hypothetical protein